jgi:predicted dehydrogenase
VCVIGLGLIGQLATRLALASGMEVVGIDLSPWAVERARSAGVTAFVESGTDTTEAVLAWSRGKGVDAVIVTAATPSSEPMLRAPALLRDRGIIAVVGDVGLELKRTPLYEKELSVRLARSYGPGRYDRAYEEWGVDYPPGFVPFSAARNMETFLNLVGSGRLGVSDLVTHSFPVAEADRAYEVIGGGGEPYLGVLLTFDEDETSAAGAPATKRSATHGRSAGLIGAGGFVRSVLYPAIGSSQLGIVTSVASKSGRSARYLADQHSLGVAESPEDLIADPHIDIVVVATPHDSHAELVCAALQAGKHVFCEKPLALSVEELEAVRTAWLASEGQLAVGFNRRHATAVREAVSVLAKAGNGPVVVTYRVNAGRLPQKHWYHDRLQGGRLVGEICHFVDTCQALTGSNEFSVTALGSGASEPILEEDLALLIRYTNGSTAAITYASGGHSAMEKEHVDIIGRGHSIRIVDFRQLFVDGHEVKLQSPDKGHTEQLRHFAKVLEGSEDGIASAERSIASMLATLNLAACLTQPIAAPGPAVG